MKTKTFASSSKANCYQISDSETTIIIEAGLSLKKLLKLPDFDISKINGVLVSHSHADHSEFINDFLKLGITCYMTFETAESLKMDKNSSFIEIIKPKKSFKIGSLTIKAFETQHDCAGSVGFWIKSETENKRLVFATDTFYLKPVFSKINYYMIECNYDAEILEKNIEAGIIDGCRVKRLKSSHFSLQNVIEFFKAQNLSECEKIQILHLSKDNADAENFKKRIMEITGIPVEVY
jgi:phosphoribosyl 1,2-cyclic phosphodiesterase